MNPFVKVQKKIGTTIAFTKLQVPGIRCPVLINSDNPTNG
jgi:hypothetical protein